VEIGQFNKLEILRQSSFGYYLNGGTGNSNDDILLPNNNALGKELHIGDEVNAFIYRDSQDRLVATLREPLAKVGELAYLKVVTKSSIGSFVDFGLERDLFVPLREQKYDIFEGRSYLFYVYLDKTGRLAATTEIEDKLEIFENPSIGEEVTATVYGIQSNNTLKVAIDNKFIGIVLKNEYYTYVHMGEIMHLRIKKVYEDGKLGLTPRAKKLEERDVLQEKILQYLRENQGVMIYNDKSSSEDIRRQFNTSKNYFKIALGGLMKKNLIIQDKDGTKLK